MGDLTADMERRNYPRVRIHIDTQLTAPGCTLRGHTLDLSAGGAFVQTPRPIPVGTGVRLALGRGAARNPLVLDAEVVRVGDTREGRLAGLGVRFIGLTALETGLLQAMLAAA